MLNEVIIVKKAYVKSSYVSFKWKVSKNLHPFLKKRISGALAEKVPKLYIIVLDLVKI